MASFTDAGDSVELFVKNKGDTVDIDISGTYDQTILFQREQGSKGSGSWDTIRTYDTENATVAENYVTERFNENLRLFLSVDGGGTATATLADNEDRTLHEFKDAVGRTRFTIKEGGIASTGGVGRGTVTLDEATVVLNAEDHANRLLLLDRSGGIDMDLPDATGSGDVYEFIVVTATADAYEISAFDVGDDDVFGVICGVDDSTEFTWGAGANDNTVTLGGTDQATGGSVGDWVRCVDVAAGKWSVQGFIHQGGSEATPFSTDS